MSPHDALCIKGLYDFASLILKVSGRIFSQLLARLDDICITNKCREFLLAD